MLRVSGRSHKGLFPYVYKIFQNIITYCRKSKKNGKRKENPLS